MSMRRPWGFQRCVALADSWTYRLVKDFAPSERVESPVFRADSLFAKGVDLEDHIPVGGFWLDFFIRCNTTWNAGTQLLITFQHQSLAGGMWRDMLGFAIGVGGLKYRLAGYRLPDLDRFKFVIDWESSLHVCEAVHLYATFRTK